MARLAFIVGEGFEDAEFQVPYERLAKAGHRIEVMGEQPGSDIHGKRGEAVAHTDVAATASYPDHYDALVIPGGHGPDRLRTNDDIVAFVKGFMKSGKPVAAICHGPQLLIEADAVRGLTLTSWPSVKTDLINAGATWVDQEVVQDHNLITSRSPRDLDAFCAAISEALQPPPAHLSHVEQTKSAVPGTRMPDVAMDEEGFLTDPQEWNEALARWLAKQEGVDELSEARWQVIYALRDYYQAHHRVPEFRTLCKAAHQDDDFCMEKLFKNDGSKAWRIAGLPNPGEEFKAYL